MSDALEVSAVDPRSSEASELIRALSQELARRYDFVDDGSGDFKPEDVLMLRSGFVVGRIGSRPVACGAFRPLERAVCEIKRMFVAPDFRGRGYSKSILAELERLAANMGYAAARLETGDRQPEAIGLYERAGYQRIPNFGIYIGSERSVCFEKELSQMSPDERQVLELLDTIVRSNGVYAQIGPIVDLVAKKLAQNRAAPMAWETIPVAIYGNSLPPFIRSSWLFMLRAGATTGAERHPNSHQRMVSFHGTGDLQTGGDGHWQSQPLLSEKEARLEQRWCSIPANVWHQAVVPDEDWVVVSFHTVPAEELIEERPDPSDVVLTRQRRYL